MVILPQLLIQFTTILLWLLSQQRPLPHSTSTFHFQEDLCGASISDFAVRSKVPVRRSGFKKNNKRNMFLTLEPLADSLLAPRRDRLHARSPATVAASVSSRPGRLLSLRGAAGRRKCWSWFGVGRWRIALLPTGTGKSPPWCQPIVRNCQARPGAETPPSYTPTPSLPGGIVCVSERKVLLHNFPHTSMRNHVMRARKTAQGYTATPEAYSIM